MVTGSIQVTRSLSHTPPATCNPADIIMNIMIRLDDAPSLSLTVSDDGPVSRSVFQVRLGEPRCTAPRSRRRRRRIRRAVAPTRPRPRRADWQPRRPSHSAAWGPRPLEGPGPPAAAAGSTSAGPGRPSESARPYCGDCWPLPGLGPDSAAGRVRPQ